MTDHKIIDEARGVYRTVTEPSRHRRDGWLFAVTVLLALVTVLAQMLGILGALLK